MRSLLIASWLLINCGPLLGADAPTTPIPLLIQQLGSDDFQRREQAAQALIAAEEPALAPLHAALKSSDREIARRARECIAVIERNVKIAALIKQLREDPDPQRRARAIVDLNEFGEEGAESSKAALIRALDDSNTLVRRLAGSALVHRFKTSPSKALTRMLEIVQDEADLIMFVWLQAAACWT
ncbi:MAG: HEAT repeat domain-containing protein [Gemmataceae bacterium]